MSGLNVKKLSAIFNTALFFALIAVMAVSTIISKKADFSEEENRYLAEAPKLSASSWFSGGYSEGLSEYSREHFVLRNGWISLRTKLERLLGHDEISGVYFSDGRLFEVAEPVDYDKVDRSVEAINSLGKTLGGKLGVMIAPTSAQIYSDRLPSYTPDQEQRRLINYVYSELGGGIQAIDVYDVLYRERENYIYYRTDHHWTAYGAYIAYSEYMRRLGYNPVTLDKIDIEHADHSFLGSYHSKVLTDEVEPDTVDFYSSGGAEVTSVKITSADGSTTEHEGVYFREYLAKKDKYLSFLGPNAPLVEIDSNAGGGSVLIIKDSYANCFAPLLAKHFSKVVLADMRYMMKLSDYVDPSSFDRVLVLYNASNFASDGNLVKLEADFGEKTLEIRE